MRSESDILRKKQLGELVAAASRRANLSRSGRPFWWSSQPAARVVGGWIARRKTIVDLRVNGCLGGLLVGRFFFKNSPCSMPIELSPALGASIRLPQQISP